MKKVTLACLWWMPSLVLAQAVDVTLSLDQPSLGVGQTTTLRVVAEIKPGLSGVSEQIFSWYVDVQNSDSSAGQADYESLVMTTSDNTANLFSAGTNQGASRRGIFNTFLNRPGAGKGAPVELLAIPVTAGPAGVATFSVVAGTTVPSLAHDFIVATTNQVNPFTGGDYTAASVTLTVTGPAAPEISLARITQGMKITFSPVTGATHVVQSRDDLSGGPDWADLPGGPHNTGSLIDSNLPPMRSYRLQVSGP